MELEPMKPDLIKRAKYEAALTVYEQVGSIKETCRQAGISYQTWKNWKRDPLFMEMFEERHEEVCNVLEKEALKRAVEGDEEDVWYKGQVVGQRKKKSDYLLDRLLQANMPDKYRNNVNVEQSGETRINLQGAIEQLKTVRFELSSDPKYLEWAYQAEDSANSKPGLLCTGSDEESEDTLSNQQPPEAD